MSLVKCSVCGFIFNEEKGLADQGIKPNTKWEDVPEIFACPLCGAAKSLFEAVVEETGSLPVSQLATEPQEVANQHWSTGQLAAICANLAKACEKQWLMEEKALFEELSLYFSERSAVSANIEPHELSESLKGDLESLYPRAFAAAEQESDRGALRALTWSQKVSKISANLWTVIKNKVHPLWKIPAFMFVIYVDSSIWVTNCRKSVRSARFPTLKLQPSRGE